MHIHVEKENEEEGKKTRIKKKNTERMKDKENTTGKFLEIMGKLKFPDT